ncbi:Alpha/beta hydrolase fold-1,Alpha/Beta hydrolase fold [Cinara cedri]|uniref:Alpha/beta hydrolase fold-1,Alpha/Beta hydrolase fold n=1 Tax=Cinara cedri TaxID=506608 RepID=A0A5E4M264_9HEMI|nr:Alpha/beta hydrolase fold-1,Alpha/Beta hydrolase fold [Cinara cedri]
MNSQEISIPVPWGHIAAKTWGHPLATRVLCLHGKQDNCGTFDRLIPLLRQGFYFVCIDIPGHGHSSHFPPGFRITLECFVLAIKRVVDHLAWTTFNCIGHSMGGMISSLFASLYPEHIEKLIMIDCAGPISIEPQDTVKFLRESCNNLLKIESKTMSRSPPSYTYEQAINLVLTKRPSKLTRQSADVLIQRTLQKHSNDSYSLSTDQRMKIDYNQMFSPMQHMFIIHSIKCPVLYLLAVENLYHNLPQIKSVKKMYKSNPNVQIVKVNGNHDVHLNHPERIADLINNFLLSKLTKTYGDDTRPAVLCVHGIQDNCDTFVTLLPLLPNDYYYVCVDLPGHGRSARFPSHVPLEFVNYLGSIKWVVDHFSWSELVYLGHSFGGQLGSWFAAVYPDLVRCLVVLDTMGPRPVKLADTLAAVRSRVEDAQSLYRRQCGRQPPVYTFDEAVGKMMAGRPSRLTDESARILARRGLVVVDDEADDKSYTFACDQRLKLAFNPLMTFDQHEQILSNIACPTVFVLADENRARYSTYLKDAYEFYTKRPNVTVKVVSGDHDVHLNHPDRVFKHVCDFLRQHCTI